MIRVRIAPSPTGSMHVGTARTALFNWLFAKKNNGVFILRIEDTDKERSKKEYEESIINGLDWLGLDYGEFYRQSERMKIYEGHIKKLLDSGNAFYCCHTAEELEREKEEQVASKLAPRHLCSHKGYTKERGKGPACRSGRGEVGHSNQSNSVIRFANLGGKIKFTDLIRNEIEFDASLLGDFAIAKDEKTPLYNLAAAIDDFEMKISHVIRGEDHISNTPKQLLMYQALGLTPPQYAHLSMILGTDKSKLSKRHGATSLLEYRDQGYLPDAMFNFLALLGWSPQKETSGKKQGTREEIMTREEIIEKFSLDAVQKSGAVFNIEKLDWMNGEYIRAMSLDKLTNSSLSFLPSPYEGEGPGLPAGQAGARSFERIKKIIALEQPRLKKLSEIGESSEFFFKDKLEYDRELLRWKDMSGKEVKEILRKLEKLLDEVPEKDFTKQKLETVLMNEAEKIGDRGKLLWPFRVALTGRKASPGPFEVAEILGKKKSLARVREAESISDGL